MGGQQKSVPLSMANLRFLLLAASVSSSASSYPNDPSYQIAYELEFSSDAEECLYEPGAFFEETVLPEIESELVFSDDEGCFVMREADLRSEITKMLRDDVDSDDEDDDDDDGHSSMLSTAKLKRNIRTKNDAKFPATSSKPDQTEPQPRRTACTTSTRRAFARPGWVDPFL